MNAARMPLDLVIVAATLAIATGSTGATVTTEATGTANFSLSEPALRQAGSGITISGSACRRARSTLLSPRSIRLEHVVAGEQVSQTARAFVQISRELNRRCSQFSTKVAWVLADGDSVRACFDHGKACPEAAELSAKVKDPRPPATSTP
jgi:hypothetical protein